MTLVAIIAAWIIISIVGALIIARFISLSEPCDETESTEEALREDDIVSPIRFGT